MCHQLPPWMSVVGKLIGCVVVVVVAGGASCLGGDPPPPCNANCAIEVECGFRTLDACVATSCEPLTGALTAPDVDACLAAAPDCLEAGACACDDGCARIDECSGAAPDPTCVGTCDTLVEQETAQTYLENRCRIEAAECGDLAACSSVSG